MCYFVYCVEYKGIPSYCMVRGSDPGIHYHDYLLVIQEVRDCCGYGDWVNYSVKSMPPLDHKSKCCFCHLHLFLTLPFTSYASL